MKGNTPDKNNAPYLSVVAPCFNEEEVLPEFYRQVVTVCRSIGQTYEIVLVNDGSGDTTWRIIQELTQSDCHIVGINLSRNHGHQLALTAGLTYARGKRILVIDADLQDPPGLLPAMLKKIDEGADVVYGQRQKREGETAFKLATASLFYWVFSKLADTKIPQNTGDFRLMTRRVVDVLLKMPEHHRFIRGMVSWVGFTQVPLLYDRDPRYAGKTKFPIEKMARFAADAIIGMSSKPLKLATWLGVFGGIVGLGFLGYTLIAWSMGLAGSGWTGLIGIIALFSSCQLIVLGVLGEYLARMYTQIQGRPLFVVKDVLRIHPTESSVAEIVSGSESGETNNSEPRGDAY
jgi:dolichol-phosphate mannosyltransferase